MREIHKTNVAPWVDWQLPDGTRLLQVTTNILYHHYLGYHLKQKRYGMYVNRMQGSGKHYNVVGIPTCHFVQRYLYEES